MKTMFGREHSGKVKLYTSEESLQNMLLWGTLSSTWRYASFVKVREKKN